MNRTRPTGAAARRGRKARAASRRRWGWIVAVAVVLALAGTIIGLRLANHATIAAAPTAPAVGQVAPDGTFTTVAGTTTTVASLRGTSTLLWFVATWCPSCQAGTPVVAQQFPQLRADKVRVVEIELFDNIGQPGPSITDFGRTYAGSRYGDPDWTFGTSSAQLTTTYNPNGYTDIYYLLDTTGRVTYINGQPASTMPDLLNHAATLA